MVQRHYSRVMAANEQPSGKKNSFAPNEIDMLASSIAFDVKDLDSFLPVLVDKIRTLQVGSVSVKNKKRIFGSSNLEKATFGVGDLLFQITPKGNGLLPVCVISKVIGGVSVKNQQVTLEEWLKELVVEMTTHAVQAGRDRAAIERALGIDL